MTTYHGWMRGGQVVFDLGSSPPDGTRVSVTPETDVQVNSAGEGFVDPVYRLSDLAVDTGITDMSAEHDHYIYGTPKRGDGAGNPA